MKNRTLTQREIAIAIGNGRSLGLLPVSETDPPVPAPEPKTAPKKKSMNIQEAIAYSGLAEWRIRTLIWSEAVKAWKEGKRWIIDRASFDEYLGRQSRGA